MTQPQNSFEQDTQLLTGIFENKKETSKIKSYFKSGVEKSLIKFFTDLARTPDLNESVLAILKPALLRSYSLISGEHKETFSLENRRKIENILGRDFPKLLSIYQTIPLDTRNEQIITDNKTYRQNLIENFAYLVAKLREIEEESLHSVQQQTLMTNQVIREYYGNLEIAPNAEHATITEEAPFEVMTQHLLKNQKEQLIKIATQFPEFSWGSVKDKLMTLQKSRIEKKLLASEKREQAKEKEREKERLAKSESKEASFDYSGFIHMMFVVCVFGVFFMTIGLIMKKDAEYQKKHHEQVLMINGLSNLLSEQAQLSSSVKALQKAQNPDYQYYLPHLQWNPSADKKTVHITIDHLDNWGCRSALNQMPDDQYGLTGNVQINHHPVAIEEFNSVVAKNKSFCTMENNNQLEYDAPFIASE